MAQGGGAKDREGKRWGKIISVDMNLPTMGIWIIDRKSCGAEQGIWRWMCIIRNIFPPPEWKPLSTPFFPLPFEPFHLCRPTSTYTRTHIYACMNRYDHTWLYMNVLLGEGLLAIRVNFERRDPPTYIMIKMTWYSFLQVKIDLMLELPVPLAFKSSISLD